MFDHSSICQALAAVAASLKIYEFVSDRLFKKLCGVDKLNPLSYIFQPLHQVHPIR